MEYKCPSLNDVELVIDDEQGFPQTTTRTIDDVRWKFVIQSNDDGRSLEVHCTPKKVNTYWDYYFYSTVTVYSGEDGTNQEEVKIKQTFSNYTPTASVLLLKSDVDELVVSFIDNHLQVYDFTKAGLFSEPLRDISDVKLKVEGQEVYACKKILATYSKFFYKLFYESDETLEQYEIDEVSCNLFRVFLGLLYYHNNLLTAVNELELSRLAVRFEAKHCSEACEKFLIEAKLSPVHKLSLAKDNNFEVLYFHILSDCHSHQDVMLLGGTWRYCNFSQTLKLAMMERMIELRRGDTPDPSKGKFVQRSTSFSEKEQNLTDMILSVGGKKFHVSKQLLAYNSNYFNTLFYSDFNEKGMDEVELKEIDAEEFEAFLQFVYHPDRIITVANVEALLKLSQMYDVQPLLQNCVTFLKTDEEMSNAKKISIAIEFHVQELFDHVISKMTKITDLAELLEIDQFNELDMDTFEQIVDIWRTNPAIELFNLCSLFDFE